MRHESLALGAKDRHPAVDTDPTAA
jgi:hypothetical protein